MADDVIARVHFFDRQVLRLQDLVDEQAYHLGAHRRHNISHHVWGIVSGLGLFFDREEGALYVEPGLAIDLYGRELVLARRLAIGPETFADRSSDVLDVFLNYNRIGSDPAPNGWAGCDVDGDRPFYRWLEQPFITFELPGVPPVDRRRPDQAEPEDVGFDASRLPPDDPGRRCPVFLGQVTLDRGNDARPFMIDHAGRPYAGLVGGAVYAPSGRAAVQIGAERPGDPNRFAVFIPEAEKAGQAHPGRPIRPRLAIDDGGRHTIRGDVTLHGDLAVAGHAIEFQPGQERGLVDPPWRVYHVEQTPSNGVTDHQLRIEMARAEQPEGHNQVVIGTWAKPPEGGPEGFRACLTVADDCSVTVHGDLVLTQLPKIVSEDAVVDAGLGPEAQSLALSAFLSGVTGSSALIRTPPGGAETSSPVLLQALTAALTPENTLRAAAAAIAAEPKLAETFAALLREGNEEAAAQLRSTLTEPEPDQRQRPAEGEVPPPEHEDASPAQGRSEDEGSDQGEGEATGQSEGESPAQGEGGGESAGESEGGPA